ncbi:MAG TPA: hypothetical protein VFW18_08615 [Gaiellales bacterium]|nr:hypothetical protein [Gaiellales bacterium]
MAGAYGGRGRQGTLCPVCLRATSAGRCDSHGQWNPGQLLTRFDKRQAGRVHWTPFAPALHACPRCLGGVAQRGSEMVCIEHDHGANMHGPFQVDELLCAAGQRESAMARERLGRARDRRARRQQPIDIQLPSLDEIGHVARLAAAVAVAAATLAFLAR